MQELFPYLINMTEKIPLTQLLCAKIHEHHMPSKWIDLAVMPHFSWPNKKVELCFDDKKIVLQPGTADLSCAISVYDENGLSFEEGGKILYRFLSRLAWSQDGGIEELFICGSNSPKRPGLLGRGTYARSGWAQVEPWDYLYLPIPGSDKADRALALFREAMNVNSIPFSFLSYFKVLNIRFASGAPQKDWINNNLGDIKYGPGLERLNELQNKVPDIGAYLYHQGRCSVAHAYSDDIVNPDDYEDKRRLELDLPLMKEIASVCIEKEFGVKTHSSFWEYLRENDVDSPELLKKVLKWGQPLTWDISVPCQGLTPIYLIRSW
jgi:hypothetical protein